MTARLLLLCGILLLAGFTEPSPQAKPLDPAEAAKQGRELVAEILSQKPAQNFTNTGVLKVRPYKSGWSEVPVRFEAMVTATNWQSAYQAIWSNRVERLLVVHAPDQPNSYFFHTNFSVDIPLLGELPIGRIQRNHQLKNAELVMPFAGSDFWLADLGLEFFHWPEQKILKSELRKTRLCRVLESVNPQPSTNTYSRVVSWIDDESRGILHAEAYDSQNKLLKEFDTKKFRKVNDQWQLEQMEIYNVQTRSRSQIEFNFDSK